ncbi:MAG: nusG [Thermoleophilia bacterium]|nr:nusG [Thermoleophilia bacterium]
MYNWYVINTYSGHEKKVEANLHQRFKSAAEDVRFAFREVIVPTEMVQDTDKDGKKFMKEQRTLPGYLLVHMNMDNKNARLLVRDTPGVTNFVGPLGEPVPLSRAELSKLVSTAAPETTSATAAAAAEEKVAPTVLFELGEIVKVMSGPLSDFDGEITEINVEQQKLKVLVSIFERQVPVELPYDQVQKI